MPKPFPKEFRRDVVAVALRRQDPMSQVARDFAADGTPGPRTTEADARRSHVESFRSGGCSRMYLRSAGGIGWFCIRIGPSGVCW